MTERRDNGHNDGINSFAGWRSAQSPSETTIFTWVRPKDAKPKATQRRNLFRRKILFVLLMGLIALTEGAMGEEQENTKKVQVELLGKPCRAKQVLGGTVVRDRKTGRELFALTNMNEVSGAELILVDIEKDTAEVFHAPAGAGSWNVREVSDDRLVIGTFYDGTFLIFDLKSKKFIQHVRFAKEEYLWNTAMGGDGKVYTGTYPGGRLGALDLKTYEVEDCGAPAAPNLYLRYVSPTHDGRILCSFSTEKPVEKLYDPKTKAWSEVPESIKGVTMAGVWDGKFVAGNRLFEGPEFTPVKPNFPTPPKEKGDWYIDVTLTNDRWLVMHQGNAVYGWKKGDAAVTKLGEMDLRGGRYMAVTENGRLLGVRGQDYFVLRPGDKTLTLHSIPSETAPRNMLFLRVDEKGRIWSGAPFGQTLCYLDPKTKKEVNTRTVCDAGGEVYDVTFKDGRVYAAAYAGGDIVEYTPGKPWDQWNKRNPRPLATVSPGYIRPVGGIHFGPDGKLYSAWMAKYGTYGGAVAITDPVSGKTELIENPLGEQAVNGLAIDPRPEVGLAYLCTNLSANGLPGKRGKSARFGILDLKTRKVTFSHTFEGASDIRAVACDPATELVAFAVGSKLTLFDLVKRAVVPVSDEAPRVGSGTISAPGKGRLLYGSGKAVIEFTLATRMWRQVAEVPEKITNLALSKDGKIYVSCGASVYSVKGEK